MSKKSTFEQLFRSQYPRLYYYALQLLKDAELSRDIVSETFTLVWENFDSYVPETLPAFLLKTVKNKCLDQIRHASVHLQYADYYLHAVEEAYSQTDENEERQRQVAEMMDRLPDTTRHVLEECYLHQKKYREVAEEMNVCQETVKRHIMRALKLLREGVKNEKS